MLPKNYQTLSVPEIEAQGAVLLDPQSSLKQKKKALMILAHRGSFEAYRLLKRYRRESEPEPELRVWADMAFDECKTFLRTNLYKENQIVFNAILNVGRNDPCPCGSGKKFKYCCGKA
ncbi:SEC-C domain-containing protein [candidate division KSB1 bacterium]|nr:SEC-C domain-containing protein [candidate division KSB1 bacterium]